MTIPIGTLSRKIHCQLATSSPGIGSAKLSRTQAPYAGPMAMPMYVAAPSTPRAVARARPVKRWLASAIDSGTSAPPPKPCTTRAAMSQLSPSSGPAMRDIPAPAEPMTKRSSAMT